MVVSTGCPTTRFNWNLKTVNPETPFSAQYLTTWKIAKIKNSESRKAFLCPVLHYQQNSWNRNPAVLQHMCTKYHEDGNTMHLNNIGSRQPSKALVYKKRLAKVLKFIFNLVNSGCLNGINISNVAVLLQLDL